MREFQLSMNGHRRPVITLYGNEALIDTGAVIPMVSLSVELIKLAWNAKLVQDNISIGGIGGEAKGSIYTLYDFKIGDFIFKELDVFVPDIQNLKYTYLLSATIFYGTDFQFDMTNDNNQIFTVKYSDKTPTEKTFKVKSLQNQLYIQVDDILLQDSEIQIKNIDNYTQEFEIE